MVIDFVAMLLVLTLPFVFVIDVPKTNTNILILHSSLHTMQR